MTQPLTHRARKRFGQNFLQNQSIIQDIVRAMNLAPTDTVIEIGPGLGALTTPLATTLDYLHVIEIDRDLIKKLQQHPLSYKLNIHANDVLNFDFSSVPGRKKIVGNLPYNISTPLLLKLSTVADEIIDTHFMLQKEVALRIAGSTNSHNYGRLSVMLQYFFDIEYLFDVPPEAFSPVPKVDSAIIRMIGDKGRVGLAYDEQHFAQLVKQAFSLRRKTIRNNLKSLASDEALGKAAIDPNARPENIEPQQYVILSNLLTSGSTHLQISR